MFAAADFLGPFCPRSKSEAILSHSPHFNKHASTVPRKSVPCCGRLRRASNRWYLLVNVALCRAPSPPRV